MNRSIEVITACIMLAALPACSGDVGPAVAEVSEVERVAGGFGFTEGPVATDRGSILFTDIPNNRIHEFNPVTGITEVYRENSNGSNGLAVKDGHLYACEQDSRRITVSKFGDEPQTLTDLYRHKKLNGPNDLVVDSEGGVYFTDPAYGRRKNLEQDGIEGVYYRAPTGVVNQVIDDMVRPNGIALSPNDRTLYVSDIDANRIIAYDVPAPGQLRNSRLLATHYGEKRGSDGMTVDGRGNLYTTGSDTNHVWVFDPTGKLINKIHVPENPSNVAFGSGSEGDVLYITARTGLYRVRLSTWRDD